MMIGKERNDNKIQAVLKKLYPRISGLYLILPEESTYEELQADDFLKEYLAHKGTLSEAYRLLFSSSKKSSDTIASSYDAFTDETLFEKDNFSGSVDLENRRYNFHILKISENESVLMFFENIHGLQSDKFEKLKMDTIQENYLFSMIVDLKNDTCKNSTTTELSVERQDYLDIKYSQWRYMIANMFLPDDKSMFLMMSEPEYIIHQLEQEKLFKFEIQMQNMQGEYIWVRLMFNRMKGFSRENPVFVYTVQDIHEDMLRLLQQENIIAAVEEKNQQLSDINMAKTVFISNMSHEIRTPINAVLGMDEMILRETTDETIRSYANDIKNAGKMLLSIINDILDFSKIEVGKMEIIPVEYRVADMIQDIYNLISIRLKEKQLAFHTEIEETIPSLLYGDELRIKQVIINILTNAVKYTETGSITFHVSHTKIDSDKIGLAIKITDTGIGMKQDEMKNLFTAFQRLDEQRNRRIEGTGLGMSIVVRLLEQMNSKLEVSSVYGKGSSFSFILPQEVANPTPIGAFDVRRKPQDEKARGKQNLYAPKARILAVDDTRTNLIVVKGLLKRTAIQLDCARSGRECLEMIRKNHYDLLLLDHLMPDMDGIETLGHIRGMGGKFETLPVIALTANVMTDARERYINAGFTDFLEKPIIASKLDEALLTYLPQHCFE